MKRKTKRECNKKRRCTRRKMRGGSMSIKDYQENLFNAKELLKREDIIKLLKEAEEKEAKEKEETIDGLIFKYGREYIELQLATIKAASAAAKMASSLSNNPQALLEGTMAGQLQNSMADKLQNSMAGQLQNSMADKLQDSMAQIPKTTNELISSQIPKTIADTMADKPQSGGKSNKNPIFPLLRTKESSIIGGRIESSIRNFLG